MKFCPICSNCLIIEDWEKKYRFKCKTCPYYYPVDEKIKISIQLKSKQIDDILGGAEAWANVDSTREICPKCNHDRAFYRQIQTRSADEAMTIFYKCANFQCNFQWSVN